MFKGIDVGQTSQGYLELVVVLLTHLFGSIGVYLIQLDLPEYVLPTETIEAVLQIDVAELCDADVLSKEGRQFVTCSTQLDLR